MNFLEGPLFENTSFISSPNLQPLIPTVLAWPPNGTQSNQIILKTAQEEMVSIPIECYCKQPEDLFGVICKKKILQRKLYGVELETSIIGTFRVHFSVHNTEKE